MMPTISGFNFDPFFSRTIGFEHIFERLNNIAEENLGAVDRDLLPENSINLTFNFRNLGDYQWFPKLPQAIRDMGKF